MKGFSLMMAAEKLRDLNQPIDVDVLDATVAAFYSTGSKEEVNKIQIILLKAHPWTEALFTCKELYSVFANKFSMSDLLSPILFIMKDESEAFWCFVSLLERLGPNFNRHQSGMHSKVFALSKVLTNLLLNLRQIAHNGT